MTRDKVLDKLKNKKMKNTAISPEISSYIGGWNEALDYAIKLLEKRD